MFRFVFYIIYFVNILINNSESSTEQNDHKISHLEWSYTKETSQSHYWSQLDNTMCGGFWQSPVDIEFALTEYKPQLKPIRIFRSASAPPGICKASNNRHSLMIQFPMDTWFVTFDGTDRENYAILQMHFHWGNDDSVGSEHTMNGKRYPLEAHIVSYRKSLYSNSKEALSRPGGLAVLGILYELDTQANASQTHLGLLGNLTQILETPLELLTQYPMSDVNLTELLGQLNTNKYFRYQGSLTTPPCTENVMWTVFEHPVAVTPQQLQLLRSQKFADNEVQHNMGNNFRPVQPLNTRDSPIFRKIYRSSGKRISFIGLQHVLVVILGYLSVHF